MPGCLMAMGRLNRPGAHGLRRHDPAPGITSTATPKLDIVSAFQCYGEYLAGKIDRRRAPQKSSATPVPAPAPAAACTRPTRWPSAIEAMGMSLPYSSSIPADDPGKLDECLPAGTAIRNLLEHDIKPRDIMTRAAFENAMVVVMALGGSTNAVLHLIAMARAVDVPLTIDDFQTVSDRVPFLADLQAERQVRAGRPAQRRRHAGRDEVPARKGPARRRLPDRHRQDASPRTSRDLPGLTPGQDVVHPLDKPDQGDRPHPHPARQPLRPTARSPRSPARKASGSPAPAKVLRLAKKTCSHALEQQGDHARATWSIIRYEGPKAAPACPRCSRRPAAIMGAGLGAGRRPASPTAASPAARHGFIVGHVTPEAQDGGPIALVQERRPHHDRRRSQHASTSTSPTPNWPPAAKPLESPALQGHPRHALQVHQEREERASRRLRDGRVNPAWTQ